MSNPLQRWKHGRKRPVPETDARILPLKKAPDWDADQQVWMAVVSKRLRHHTDSLPKLLGFLFGFDGTTYLVLGQETISDSKLLRKLDYAHRHDEWKRAYLRLYLEEYDPFLALVKGIRK